MLYGAAGVFGGLFLAFVDNGIGAGTKRKQLADHLVDYVENSPHFYKSVDNSAYAGQERKKAVGSSDIVDFSKDRKAAVELFFSRILLVSSISNAAGA